MNDIYIGDISSPLYHMDDVNIRSISVISNSSLLADELAYDEADVTVSTEPVYLGFLTADNKQIETADSRIFKSLRTLIEFNEIKYGDEMHWLIDSDIYGKFYVKNSRRTGKYKIDITAVSPIGMLDNRNHAGGMYAGVTFATVLAEIIGNSFSYTIDTDVMNQPVFGWLPYASARSNLHQLLFAYGVNIVRDTDGDMYFRFTDSDVTVNVPSSRVYIGGSISYAEPSTDVEITEHAFFQSTIDTQKSLYDNTDGSETADHLTVKWSNPCYGLEVTDGLTINSSGVNHAVVSGTGKLTGYEYSHSTRIIKRQIENAAQYLPKTSSITDVSLIGALNSENVAKRCLSYYSNANSVSTDIVISGEKAGDMVSFVNPFGDLQTGFISKIALKSTSVLRGQCTILSGYIPTGNGNNYEHYVVLTGTGSWTVPAGITKIRATLIGGGDGGASGGRGKGTSGGTETSYGWATGGAASNNGGKAGTGGLGGKILTAVINVTAGSSFSYSAGVGGAGGVTDNTINNVDGASGTDTTFGTYSTSAGARNNMGAVNLFTNENYGATGNNGVNGGSGGSYSDNTGTRTQPDKNGDDLIVWTNPMTGVQQTFRKGTQGEAARGTARDDDYVAYGGFGGGYAIGSDGNNGSDGDFYTASRGPRCVGGNGGNGANAVAGLDAWLYGQGGMGGHGGGGGGGGGCAHWTPDSGSSNIVRGGNSGGLSGSYNNGGAGGNGGRGADGCVLIYY